MNFLIHRRGSKFFEFIHNRGKYVEKLGEGGRGYFGNITGPPKFRISGREVEKIVVLNI